ncbi:hypothetical protein BC628DRAFT_1453871 [Trametes gibbosa]|nr:hypothetical protein BC628DRAFT_1453871 [Trametes gibbosa]
MEEPAINATLEDMRHSLEFIRLLQTATLEGSNLTPEVIEGIRNPPNQGLTIDDPDLMLWIEVYMAVGNASEETFNAVRDGIIQRFPTVKSMSLYKVKKAVEKLSGVSCVGFTGPFAGYDHCHKCGEARFCPKVPRQTFITMLPGPQIQAIFRSKEGAEDLGWFYKTAQGIIIATPRHALSLAKYFDLVSGQLLLERHDVVLMLYQNKKSDCWISLWLKRYKKIYLLPGTIIPGPNHPQVLDSFMFPGFFHAFHATLRRQIISRLFLALGTADGPGMAMFNGSVGHHGTLGCRRHKPGCPHYYPALLRPTGDLVPGCAHDDISLASIPLPSLLLSARTDTQYKQLRRATGLCLSRTLPVPFCFPLDLMHLTCLNIPELFVNLWRGTILGSTLSDPKTWDCAILADPNVWLAHGLHVERARSYLPGFFDRAPRNIADKLNSGYKAIEYKTWFYNYAPAMLRWLLPCAYWLQLCELVRGVTILYAEDISPADLVESKRALTRAVEHYEALYYARNPDRLHVVRPCIHLVWHCPDQIVLTGSLISDTQLPMERLIGDLGSEIKQHANPCQVNALKAMLPHLNRASTLTRNIPRGALALGDGYILLRAMDNCMRTVSDLEARAFYEYFSVWAPTLCLDHGSDSFSWRVRKWARLQLPQGMVARSAWKECDKPLSKMRMARCVKFTNGQGTIDIGEVRYFCQVTPELSPVAMVSVFDARDEALYARSLGTVELLTYHGEDSLRVIPVKAIDTVVRMVPDVLPVGVDGATDFKHLYKGHKYFVVQKLGFELQVFCPEGSVDPEMQVDE